MCQGAGAYSSFESSERVQRLAAVSLLLVAPDTIFAAATVSPVSTQSRVGTDLSTNTDAVGLA